MSKQNFVAKHLLILLVAAFGPITVTSRLLLRCQKLIKPGYGFLARDNSQIACICEKGYQRVNEACVPICDPACCENFECIDVNVCECKDGYKFAAGQCVSISFCDCPAHSICTYQGVCECETGYKMVAGKCEAICNPECGENGYCDQPNVCRCKKGYEITNLSASDHCKPVCQPLCRVDQFCLKPGVCICKPGYVLLANGDCEPICSAGCGDNERCVGVEYCECKPGFYRNEPNDCAAMLSCFKKHLFIPIRCDSSIFIVFLIYSPICILPLIAIYFAFIIYKKFGLKYLKKTLHCYDEVDNEAFSSK